jgi:hypothetical protein
VRRNLCRHHLAFSRQALSFCHSLANLGSHCFYTLVLFWGGRPTRLWWW